MSVSNGSRAGRGLRALCALGVLVVAGSCAKIFTEDAPLDEQPGCAACDGSLDSLRATFGASCASAACHDANQPAAGLDLASDGVEQRLIGIPAGLCDPPIALVVPGDPEASLLYQKLTATSTCGDPMPLGTTLCGAQIECVRTWIASLPPAACSGADLTSDPSNCGTCGNVCPAGVPCENGACQCPAGSSQCGAACIDTSSDPMNCGSCGNVCPPVATCSAGACQCPAGTEACSGACVETSSNPAHCGGCGIACGAGEVCFAGACGSDCGTLTQCGQACVDTTISTLHCGQCDTACPLGQTCTASSCACPGGLSACSNGCFDLAADETNCGTCGKLCPAGSTCEAGQCVCPAGKSPCPSGCVDLATDLMNCGSCGTACAGGLVCESALCQCKTTGSESFSGQIQPIFTQSCTNAGCHGGVKPAANLQLTSGKSYAALVGVTADQCGGSKKRVVPGDPAQSYLMNKLTNTGICFGTQMPKVGVKLPAADIDAISGWICNGAPEN